MAFNAGQAVAYLTMDTSGYSEGISIAKKLMSQLNDAGLSASGKINALSDAAKQLGTTLTTTATVAVSAAGAAAVTAFTSFDDAMKQVQATMAASEEDMALLTATAKQMGADTRYSATEAGEALNYLALAGYDARQACGALPQVLSLAQAGGLNLAYASDLATDAMSALGLGIGDLSAFTDQMARTSQKANTNVAQLGEAILTVGGTAKQLAGGTVELNTQLGILADNGIKGSEGGTVLRNVILSLTAPTDQAAKRMQALGLSCYDAGGKLRSTSEIFRDLNAILGSMSMEERNSVLSELFEKADLKGVEALLANCTDRYRELSAEITNSAGTTRAMAETMESGIGGAFRSLASAGEAAAISFGEALAPTVQNVAKGITGMAQGFASMPESVQQTVAQTALLAAGAGPVLIAGSKLISMGQTLFAVMSGPAGWITLGIAGAAALVKGINAIADAAQGVSISEKWQAMMDGADKDVTATMSATINAEVDTQPAENSIRSAIQQVADALTDGEEDDDETVSGLKSAVQTAFDNALSEVDVWESLEISKLDPDAPDFETACANIRAQAQATRDELETLRTETVTFVDKMAGESTEEVKAHLGELDEIEARVDEVLEKIGLATSEGAGVGSAEYQLVRAGATMDAGNIAAGVQWAYQNYKLDAQAIEDAAAQARAEADAAWQRGEMSAAEHLAAEEQIDAQLAEQNAAALEVYRSRMSELMQGVYEAYSQQDPASAGDMAVAGPLLDIQQQVSDMAQELMNTDVSPEGRAEMQAALQGFYDGLFGEGTFTVDETMLGPAVTDLNGRLENLISQSLSDFNFEENPLSEILAGIAESGAMEPLDIDLTNMADAVNAAMGDVGTGGGEAYSAALSAQSGAAESTGSAVGQSGADGAGLAKDSFRTEGLNAGQGYANGIRAKTAAVRMAAASLARTAASALAAAQDSHSPSRLFRKKGHDGGDGYVLGLRDRIPDARRAAAELVDLSLVRPSPSVGTAVAGSGGAGGAARSAPDITIRIESMQVRQESDIDRIASRLGAYISSANYM